MFHWHEITFTLQCCECCLPSFHCWCLNICFMCANVCLINHTLHVLIHLCNVDQLCRIVKERKALEQKMENKKCRQRCKIPSSGTSSDYFIIFPYLWTTMNLFVSLTQTLTHMEAFGFLEICTVK